ncbi:MAG: hypothetical protein J6P66_07230 [Bacteroidaceae bacterium]|nr:hypothetical protein [Bacteroidaceae bacterium]
MKTSKLISLTVLLFFQATATTAFAQDKFKVGDTISGIIREEGGPMMMVNVTERDSLDRIVAHSVTDFGGYFSFRLVNPGDRIQITYVGYETVDIPIDTTFFEIKMKEQDDLPPIEIIPDRRQEAIGPPIPIPLRDNTEYSTGQDWLSLSEINKLKEKVLIFMDGITWDIDFYDSDYFDCENISELKNKASDFLNLNSEDIVSVRYLKDDDAIKAWGSRGKYGVLEVRTNQNNFVSQLKVSGKEPKEGDVILVEVKDENGPLMATVDLPGNEKQAMRGLGSTDKDGRLAFRLAYTGDHIKVQCPGYHGVYQAIKGTRIEITMKKNPYLNEADVELGRRNVERARNNYGYRMTETTVSGDKPKANGTVSGALLVEGSPVSDCMIAEIDSNGEVVSKTQTDKDGNFSIAIKNPEDFLFIGYNIASYDVPLIKITGHKYRINMAPRILLRG